MCVKYKKMFYNAAKMEKCNNSGLYKGGVANARRADVHNRNYLGDGRVPT